MLRLSVAGAPTSWIRLTHRDITPSIKNYREAARHLWNFHYLTHIGNQDPWDVRDAFDVVSIALFKSLVLEPIDCDAVCLAPMSAANPSAMNGIFVTPKSPDTAILINRDRQQSDGYWDHSKKRIGQGEATMLLSRFFDWDKIGFSDFRYLQVLIISATSKADIVDHWALLDFESASVFADNQLEG